MRALLLWVLLSCFVAWSLLSGRLQVPDAWNPWAPLRIDDAPNWLTGFKLKRASGDEAACKTALAGAHMDWTPLEDRVTGEGCGFESAVRIERSSVEVGEAFSLSCRAALSLAMWERHVLQPVARTQTGQTVVAIEHYGSYACRNLYGEPGRRRSRHATADALDVAAFVLADGRRVPVTAYAPGVPEASLGPDARLLRDLHVGACRYFDGVLGPGYNRAHADHFHFDRGSFRICR